MMSTSQLADPELGTLDDIVDLERYPLHRPGLEATELVGDVRSTLAHEGSVTLPGFLRPEAVDALGCELGGAAAHVPIRRHSAGVYHRDQLEADLAPDDPRCVKQDWFAGHVTRDMIPAYSPAHRLYVSPGFKQFIAGCVGQARVFEYADPIAGLVATVLPPGGTYPWHYDTNEFVVTIMVSPPEDGGVFEYCKDLRSPGDENFDGLSQVLSGADRSSVRTSASAPGDLQLFLGRFSLHRVTEVTGSAARHVLVLSYADRPGVIGPLDRTRSVYGRVTEAHLLAAEASATAPDGLIL